MPLITDRTQTLEIIQKAAALNMSLISVTALHPMQTQAYLIAAEKFARDHGFKSVPLVIAFKYAPGARGESARSMFLTQLGHLRMMTTGKYASHPDLLVMSHLDLANPATDFWALSVGLSELSSVAFDARQLPPERALTATKEYVGLYGQDVVIEASLPLPTSLQKYSLAACEEACEFVASTDVDFLIPSLISTDGEANSFCAEYARMLTRALKRRMLVLEEGGRVPKNARVNVASYGIVRIGLGQSAYRMARHSATEKLLQRVSNLRDPYSVDINAFYSDLSDKLCEIVPEMMRQAGYANWRDD